MEKELEQWARWETAEPQHFSFSSATVRQVINLTYLDVDLRVTHLDGTMFTPFHLKSDVLETRCTIPQPSTVLFEEERRIVAEYCTLQGTETFVVWDLSE